MSAGFEIATAAEYGIDAERRSAKGFYEIVPGHEARDDRIIHARDPVSEIRHCVTATFRPRPCSQAFEISKASSKVLM